MKKVKLHLQGELQELCGGNSIIEIGAQTPRMAIRALISRYGNKVKQLIAPNKWHLYVGSDKDEDNISQMDIDREIEQDDLYIIPYIQGAGGRLGQIIIGVLLIVAGVLLSPINAPLGAALISTGVGMILQAFFAPDVPNARETPEERSSFLFNGATNTSQQGQPVPLVFGRFRTGSALVSAGLDVEQLMNYGTPIYPGDDGSGGGSILPPLQPPWFPIIINR